MERAMNDRRLLESVAPWLLLLGWCGSLSADHIQIGKHLVVTVPSGERVAVVPDRVEVSDMEFHRYPRRTGNNHVPFGLLKFSLRLGEPGYLDAIRAENARLEGKGQKTYVLPERISAEVSFMPPPTQRDRSRDSQKTVLGPERTQSFVFVLDEAGVNAVSFALEHGAFLPELQVQLLYDKQPLPISVELVGEVKVPASPPEPRRLVVMRPNGFPRDFPLRLTLRQNRADRELSMDTGPLDVEGLQPEAFEYRVEFERDGLVHVVSGTFRAWNDRGTTFELPVELKTIVVDASVAQNAATVVRSFLALLPDVEGVVHCAYWLRDSAQPPHHQFLLKAGSPLRTEGLLLALDADNRMVSASILPVKGGGGPAGALFLVRSIPAGTGVVKALAHELAVERVRTLLARQGVAWAEQDLTRYLLDHTFHYRRAEAEHARLEDLVRWVNDQNRVAESDLRAAHPARVAALVLSDTWVDVVAKSELERLDQTLASPGDLGRAIVEVVLAFGARAARERELGASKVLADTIMLRHRRFLDDAGRERLWTVADILQVPEHLPLAGALRVARRGHTLVVASGLHSIESECDIRDNLNIVAATSNGTPAAVEVEFGPRAALTVTGGRLVLNNVAMTAKPGDARVTSRALVNFLGGSGQVSGGRLTNRNGRGIFMAPGGHLTLAGVGISGCASVAVDVKGSTVEIRKCQFTGNGEPAMLISGPGAHATLEGNTISGQRGHGVEGRLGSRLTLIENSFERNAGDGARVSGNGASLVMKANRLTDNRGNGVTAQNVAAVYFSNNVATKNGRDGFELDGVPEVSVEENDCSGNSLNGIRLSRVGRANAPARLQINVCRANLKSGIVAGGETHLRLTENHALANSQSGIALEAKAVAVLERNECAENGQAGLDLENCRITSAEGNTFRGNQGSGLVARRMISGALASEVSRNEFSGNHRCGVLLEGGQGAVRFASNRSESNHQDGFRLLGTGAPVTLVDNSVSKNGANGLQADFAAELRCHANLFRLNGIDGLAFWTTGPVLDLTENTVESNRRYGVVIYRGEVTKFTQNTLRENRYGFAFSIRTGLHGVNGDQLQGINTFERNGEDMLAGFDTSPQSTPSTKPGPF
jgi:Right handed beta helix region